MAGLLAEPADGAQHSPGTGRPGAAAVLGSRTRQRAHQVTSHLRNTEDIRLLRKHPLFEERNTCATYGQVPGTLFLLHEDGGELMLHPQLGDILFTSTTTVPDAAVRRVWISWWALGPHRQSTPWPGGFASCACGGSGATGDEPSTTCTVQASYNSTEVTARVLTPWGC